MHEPQIVKKIFIRLINDVFIAELGTGPIEVEIVSMGDGGLYILRTKSGQEFSAYHLKDFKFGRPIFSEQLLTRELE